MIIVIEGTDGSGKQTQTKLLFDYLKEKNVDVKTQSFPNYASDSSILVRNYLNGDYGDINALTSKQSSVLFAVDRLCTMNDYKEFLKNDGVLLLDRYVSSNILHQASKIEWKIERDEFVDWLENLEYNDLRLPKPDITFFLDLKPELSKKLREERGELKAGTTKDIHESNYEYLINCYKIGMEVAKNKGWNIIKCYNEDNTIKTIDEIQADIRKQFVKHLKQKNQNLEK